MLSKYIIRGNRRKTALSDEAWMEAWFPVRYGKAKVYINRDYYVCHCAQYLTDEGMRLLCRKIEKELPYYAEIDQMAKEYASGELISTPTLDDIVDEEAHRILVEYFRCPRDGNNLYGW